MECSLIKQIDYGVHPLISLHSSNSGEIVSCSYSKDAVNRSGRVMTFDSDINERFSESLSSACFYMDYLEQWDTCVLNLGDGKVALFLSDSKTLRYEPVQNDCMVTNTCYCTQNVEKATFTDSKGRLTTFDRSTGQITEQVTAHSLYGSEVSAWSCIYLDQDTVLSGGDDCILKVWDLRSGKQSSQCTVHQGGVVRIKKMPNQDNSVITGAYDQHVRTFDIRNLKSSVSSLQVEGDPWDFQLYSNGAISVACMYFGWTLVNSDWEVVYKREMTESLVYGINIWPYGNSVHLACSSFTNGIVSVFELNTSISNFPRMQTQLSDTRLIVNGEFNC